jgi:Holliday junction resolvase RusA-like endonuclease
MRYPVAQLFPHHTVPLPLALLRHAMSEIRFSVPGVPVAKARPRVTRRGITYTPAKTVRYEERVREFANGNVQLLIGPLEMSIVAYWPCKGAPRKHNPRSQAWKLTRPDGDNIAKTITDALNGIAYRDDSEIARLTVEKVHCAQDQLPRVEVLIREISES